jgi:hypothetical protein
MIANTIILFSCLLTALPNTGGGTISGVVVNSSIGDKPVGHAKVVLRVEVRGESQICGETITDEQGRFVFSNLPTGDSYLYIPGANRDEIHFPGPRVQLNLQRPRASIVLSVCDSISAPSPLVIRRQDVSMRFQSGALTVTESIVIDNPSKRCYVGPVLKEDGEPITMQLAIPSNFERTVFEEEFFGRHFVLHGDKLATSIPWLPGRRELKFTYIVPVKDGAYVWQRPLDLPCKNISVSVVTDMPDGISCNLPATVSQAKGEVVFQSAGEILPKGHVVRVEFGHLPVSLMAYTRWLALALLAAAILAGIWLILKNTRRTTKLDNFSYIDTYKKVTLPKPYRHKTRV